MSDNYPLKLNMRISSQIIILHKKLNRKGSLSKNHMLKELGDNYLVIQKEPFLQKI